MGAYVVQLVVNDGILDNEPSKVTIQVAVNRLSVITAIQRLQAQISAQARVPQDHPLRPIRDMLNQALAELSGEF